MENKNFDFNKFEKIIVERCPLLFNLHSKQFSKSNIYFGFECGQGWYDSIAEACYELEVLNIWFYSKYRVRIQAEQIKEKYGEIRFYYSVVADPNAFLMNISTGIAKLSNWIKDLKLDYKLEKVIDVQEYSYDQINELSEEEYNKKLNSSLKISNVEYKNENGKFFEVVHLKNYEKFHYQPTKFKFLWKLKNILDKTSSYFLNLDFGASNEKSERLECIINALNNKADRIVKRLEEKCANICEDCGTQIGNDFKPKYMTHGYISYLCEDCAKKKSGSYEKISP